MEFRETKADEEERRILPPDQSDFLWTVSWFSFVSGGFAIHRGYYDLSLVPIGVGLTSLNYWRRPTHDWRRSVDRVYVVIAFLYQGYRARAAEKAMLYYLLVICAVGCYPLSCWIGKEKSGWASTLLHAGVHVLGNVSNLVLYSGEIL
jgi:hypothetical protein